MYFLQIPDETDEEEAVRIFIEFERQEAAIKGISIQSYCCDLPSVLILSDKDLNMCIYVIKLVQKVTVNLY